MSQLWIIEKRKPDGALDFSEPQPEKFFGPRAITGLDDWAMSRAIYARFPGHGAPTPVPLRGDNIPEWPKNFDPNFIARRKTW